MSHSRFRLPARPIRQIQFVNVARTRAEEFGRTELVGPHAPVHFGGGGGDDGDDVSTDPSSAHVKHETRRSDLVVTTLAERRDVDGDGAEEDPDELETRPRGFFADQVRAIEGNRIVRPARSSPLQTARTDLIFVFRTETSSKTRPTSTHTTSTPVPKSGGRPAVP